MRLGTFFSTFTCVAIAFCYSLSAQIANAQTSSQITSRYTLPAASAAMIEEACRYKSGPAAQSRCVQSQIADLQASGPAPDLIGLSPAAATMLETGCRSKKSDGPATYNRCIQSQIGTMRVADPVVATLALCNSGFVKKCMCFCPTGLRRARLRNLHIG